MRNFHDQLCKGLLQNWLRPVGNAQIDYPVVGQKQEADVWFEPAPTGVAERRSLGALGRMVGRGPCLLEPFSRAPGVFAVEDCVRKQLVIGYNRAMEARTARPQRKRPARPHLWILAAGEPARVIREYGLRPMPGWPAGFLTGTPLERLHLVVQPALPRAPETLTLRLVATGVTFARAIDDLLALPMDDWSRVVSTPVLFAFRQKLPHDLSEAEAMQTQEKISVIYEEWERRVREDAERVGEQRGKEEGRRELLLALLGQRFGPLPGEARARIEAASTEELERMGLRVLTAQSLAEVLAPQER